MIIVASGGKYIDIDALACAVAYAELLSLHGTPAKAVLPGELNATVPAIVKSWNVQFETQTPASVGSIVIVDVSNPQFIGDWLNLSQVTELFDHHYGYETYWQEKLGEYSHIEAVGACATQIWEQWQRRETAKRISQISARLLLSAIISNTLNFNASVTTDRDRLAARQLEPLAELPVDFTAQYYQEVEASLIADPATAIKTDTKVVEFPNLNLKVAIGQVELWQSKQFIDTNQPLIKSVLSSQSPLWLLTSPSISESKNYLYTDSPEVKALLFKTLGARFVGDLGTTAKLFLRKEILREWQKL